MSIQIKNPADPMRDIYPTCGEAFEAGKRAGIDEALTDARSALGWVSVGYEKVNNAEAFRAAEECCRVVRDLRREKLATPTQE